MLNDSSIIKRIEQFLKAIPPFEYFTIEDLHMLAQNCLIKVYKPSEPIFIQLHLPEDYFFIVKKGAVDIHQDIDTTSAIVDKCGEGDMFGIRPILAESPYLLSATSVEQTILYLIPITHFKSIYSNYPDAVDFMLKRFAAGRSMREEDLTNSQLYAIIDPPAQLSPININRGLIYTDKDQAVIDAVKTMNNNQISSILILTDRGLPEGILTDRDIRGMVADSASFQQPIQMFMKSPVKCIRAHSLLQEVQLMMIDLGVHHLCVTEDGTNGTKALGIVTEHDLLYANTSNPVVIIKKISRATSIIQLVDIRSKIDQLAYNFTSSSMNKLTTLTLIDKMNQALIQKVVQISVEEQKVVNPSINDDHFCFYAMGSAARGEQILMTDQDNGIIVSDEASQEVDMYRQLGQTITQNLHTIGYAYCPADMMASNHVWCKTLKAYKREVSTWINSPGPDEVLNTTIFFDFRVEYGNSHLSQALKQHIQSELRDNDIFLRFLARQAISNPPPLSFFRKLIIEKNGEYKDHFDIKLRGISPLTDAARVLSLASDFLVDSSTIARFEHLKQYDEANVVLYDDAIQAYVELLAIRIDFALKNQDGGRYIDPSQLSKLERIQLRRCFRPITKLLDMLERKYKLGYL